MARQQTVEIDDAKDGPLIEDQDTVELDILTELRAAPEDETWSMSVSRVVGASKDGIKEPFLFEGDAIALEGIHTRLRDEYGTGRYRVRIVRNKRLYRRFDICVEAPKKIEPPAPPPLPRSELAEFVGAIQRSNEALVQRLLERQTIIPQVDPVSLFEKFASIMGAVQRPAPAQESAVSLMEVFTKGVDFARNLSDSSETNLYDLVKEAIAQLPTIAKLSENKPQQLPGRGAIQPSVPSSAPLQLNPQQEQLKRVRDTIMLLVSRAAKNSDPEIYAEFLTDEWTEIEINQFLNLPDPFAMVVQIAPEAGPYKEWFGRLIDALNDLGEDAAEETENADRPPVAAASDRRNPGGPTGGMGNSRVHGAVEKARTKAPANPTKGN